MGDGYAAARIVVETSQLPCSENGNEREGLLLAHYHSPYWLWFTAFVGFNLLQSSFTNFCPLEIVLGKLGIGRDAASCSQDEHEPA